MAPTPVPIKSGDRVKTDRRDAEELARCHRAGDLTAVLMGYSGMAEREHSSPNKVKRGSLTKTGNAHLRRVIVEAAWAYQRRPWIGGYLLNKTTWRR